MKLKKRTIKSCLCLTVALALLGSLCLPVFAADEVLPEEQETTETLEATVNAAEGTDAEADEDEGTEKDAEAAEAAEATEAEEIVEAAEESVVVNIKNAGRDEATAEKVVVDGQEYYKFKGGLHSVTRSGKIIYPELSGLLIDGASIPYTTDGEYILIDATVIDDQSSEVLVERQVYCEDELESWDLYVILPKEQEEEEEKNIIDVLPRLPETMADIRISNALTETEGEYGVFYVDDGLTVDYTVEGDLAPVSVYLNGVSVPFTVEVTEGAVAAATTAGDGTSGGGTAGSATQGGKIVLSSQTLSACGKVGEVNTLDVVFRVGDSTEQAAAATQLVFVLKNKVVASAPADKSEQTETKTEIKPTTETKTDSQPSTTTAPDTGDHTSQALWLSLIGFSVVGLAAVSAYRKKKDVQFFH